MNLTPRRFAFTGWPSAAAALILFAAAAAGQQPPGDSATIAKVADSIAAEVLKAPVAGVAIGVARGGDVVYRRAYGFSDVATEVRLTLKDVHQIGSLTKQFTAAARSCGWSSRAGSRWGWSGKSCWTLPRLQQIPTNVAVGRFRIAFQDSRCAMEGTRAAAGATRAGVACPTRTNRGRRRSGNPKSGAGGHP